MSSVTFLFPEEFSTLELSFTIAASHSDSSASSVSVFFYPSPTPPFSMNFLKQKKQIPTLINWFDLYVGRTYRTNITASPASLKQLAAR